MKRDATKELHTERGDIPAFTSWPPGVAESSSILSSLCHEIVLLDYTKSLQAATPSGQRVNTRVSALSISILISCLMLQSAVGRVVMVGKGLVGGEPELAGGGRRKEGGIKGWEERDGMRRGTVGRCTTG